MTRPRDVAIIGGGVTGLAAGLTLTAHPAGDMRVTIFEARGRAGGHARTRREDGYLIEEGPNGFLENDASRSLIRTLELESRLIEASRASRRRYIVRGGRLRAVPSSPLDLLFGDALSPGGRLRVLGEPWVRSRSVPRESVFEFARRRIGAEAARVLVDAAVGGITAGDSRALEIESAFPALVEMEREHGSILRALLRRARSDRAVRGGQHGKPRLVSFPRGVSELVDALERRLGTALRTGSRVRELRRAGERWQLVCEGGALFEADAVLVASQARGAATMLRGFDPVLAALLDGIPFSGVGVVALAHREAALARPLHGYGFLVPSGESGRTLGAVWESSLFASRAPAGQVLIRVMIGGARDPRAVLESDDSLIARARDDVARFMGLRTEPERVWVSRAPEAIAQYADGHAERLAALRCASARHRGLILCGTSYDGVSLASAMAAGVRAGAAVAEGPAMAGDPLVVGGAR